MKLRITCPTIEAWVHDLTHAVPHEIGGVLFGEQIREGEFRIVDATRQRFGGGTKLRFQSSWRPSAKTHTRVARLFWRRR